MIYTKDYIENNIEIILDRLNTIQELPKDGLLAGGSIANIIWEMVSGNIAKINDIDIFSLDCDEDLEEKTNSEKHLIKKEYRVMYSVNKQPVMGDFNSDYGGIVYKNQSKDILVFGSSTRDNMINNVVYKTNKNDYQLIIDTFDINCTQIGVDLYTKKVYLSNEFLDFLNSAYIKVINPSSPSHTSLRIYKKQEELNCKCDFEKELEMLQDVSSKRNMFKDKIRVFFTEKYVGLFKKYKETKLTKYFNIAKVKKYDLPEQILKEINFDLYQMIPRQVISSPKKEDRFCQNPIILHTYMYHYNNIKGDEFKSSMWNIFSKIWRYNYNFLDNITEDYVKDNIDIIKEFEFIKNDCNIASVDKLFHSMDLVNIIYYMKIIMNSDNYDKLLDIFYVYSAEIDIDNFKDKESINDFIVLCNIKYRKELLHIREQRVSNFKYSMIKEKGKNYRHFIKEDRIFI